MANESSVCIHTPVYPPKWAMFERREEVSRKIIGEAEMREEKCNCNETCGCEICCPSSVIEEENRLDHDEIDCFKNMGNEANDGMTRDDSTTATRLLDKNWSPLIVRKYQMEGWPLFISLICDANLNDLDQVVYKIHAEAVRNGFVDGKIQSSRNYCGFMSDEIKRHYDNVKRGCVEGVAIIWYVDKCFISSLYGDFMVHASCKQELFAIINTLPHI